MEKIKIIFAVPSIYIRSTAKLVTRYITEGQIIVKIAKGIGPDTLMTMSEVVNQEIPKAKVVALSGPTHAEKLPEIFRPQLLPLMKILWLQNTYRESFLIPLCECT